MWCSAVGIIVTLTLSLLTAPLAATAQQQGKVPRIGILTPNSTALEASTPLWKAFRQGLRDLGYVEGKTIILEYRFAEEKPERFPDLAAELVRLQVDVIVAGGVVAIGAAQHATRTIPIVMAGTSDPVGRGFVASLAHPGGNITGLSFLGAELPGKRLEILKETVPQSARIAVLVNPADAYYGTWMNSLTVAARVLGVQLHVVELHRADELDTAFAAITREGAEALIVLRPASFARVGRRLVELAATHRQPAIYEDRRYVEAGGLMSYGPNSDVVFGRAAYYVDRILKGAKPADLPVEQPTKFEFVINLKTAQALGLTMPPTLLFQADEVIQ